MTVYAGNIIYASDINLLAAPPIAILRQTSVQSLASGTGTAITFTTEDLDSVNGHSTSSNTSRYTCMAAGVYEFSGGVSITGSATGRRACWWVKNGVDVVGSEATLSAGDDAGNLVVPARTIQVSLAVNDYVELYGYQDSGGSLNTVVVGSGQSSMYVRRVSD